MIRLERVSVRFGEGTPLAVEALSEIDFSVAEGEFVSVIGSNGAGKSTLLGCCAGEVGVSSGRVVIDGVDVTRFSVERRAGMVARVFQDPLLGSCGSLTIEENMALASRRGFRRGLGLALGGVVRAAFRERLRGLGLGLEDRLSERVERLSGGQRQALSLLLSVQCGARVFLLDEHTAALDPRMSSFVMDLTSRLIEEQGLTTVMVTHSLSQALRFGNRLVMLMGGRIAFECSGAERSRLRIEDLVARFSSGGGALDSDELLLS